MNIPYFVSVLRDISCVCCATRAFILKSCFFNVRLLSVLHGHSFFFIPATTANDLRLRRIFNPRFYPLHVFTYLNSWEIASIFPFECSVLNKGTTGTIFITSLVWRGPWLGIEPGTFRTRSQHYTTRLSRRRFGSVCRLIIFIRTDYALKKSFSNPYFPTN